MPVRMRAHAHACPYACIPTLLQVRYEAELGHVVLEGVVSGLPVETAGGWHVHSGFSCDDAADVGGHYLDLAGSDPWAPLAYISSAQVHAHTCIPLVHLIAQGVSTISTSVRGFSLTGHSPVLGRAVVFHNAAGDRIACGLIEPSDGELVQLGSYPGLTPPSSVGMHRYPCRYAQVSM